MSETVARSTDSQAAFAKSLLRQNTIIELDGISQNTKKFLIPLLCYWIYSVQLAGSTREQLKFVIFIEEAHHILYRHEYRAKETLMNVLLRQCRELGIGVVLIDQHPHLISSAGVGNCYTTICMNQKDPSDITKAAGLSGLEEGEKRLFTMLPVGQGIVKLQDRWLSPFLVQFPLMDIQKGAVSDVLLKQFLSGEIPLRVLRERCGVSSVAAPHSPATDTLEDGAFDLLHDVMQHPDGGVDTRYKRLGIGSGRGHRYQRQLLRSKLVRSERVKVGRTYRVFLRVTNDAKLLLLPSTGRDPRASFVHEYWKRRVAHHFETLGYTVVLEAPRPKGGGCMDISAWRASESVAIEIETGKSDVVANVKRDLLSGVQEVIVVATDAGALQKVERALARAGLILPGRLRVVLRDTELKGS